MFYIYYKRTFGYLNLFARFVGVILIFSFISMVLFSTENNEKMLFLETIGTKDYDHMCPLLREQCASSVDPTNASETEIFSREDVFGGDENRIETFRTFESKEAKREKPCAKMTTTPLVDFIDLTDQPSEQRPIVTFDEWTKEKLKLEKQKKIQQQALNSIGSAPYVGISNGDQLNSNNKERIPDLIHRNAAQRNYASRECGAKVLLSNDEAENKNAILSEKERDEYMRNPCEAAKHKWIIIELCETVQPTVIQLSNFELFSSGPQNVRLLASERYPTSDWITLGEFTAENNRLIQQFPVAVTGIYFKFVRLELLSHYGKEHYCTLSVFRLLGISMVDEYEAEADAISEVISIHNTESQFHEKVEIANSKVETNSGDPKDHKDASTEEEKANGTMKDIPIVNVVVNVVSTIGIEEIKNAIQSAFSSKTNTRPNKKFRSPYKICTTCPVYRNLSSHILFCRAFFPSKKSLSKHDISANQKPDETKHSNISELSSSVHNNTLWKYSCKHACENKFIRSSLRRKRFCKETEKVKSDIMPANSSSQFVDPRASMEKPKIINDFQAKESLPGVVTSHKESIFFKLNKRITTLELNMSLSSEYLSELSRRYIEQTNLSNKQIEKAVQLAEQISRNVVESARVDFKQQLRKLAQKVKRLEHLIESQTSSKFSIAGRMEKKAVMPIVKPLSVKFNAAGSDSRGVGCLPHNDNLWTSEQLIIMIAVAQLCTLFMLLIVQYFCMKPRNSTGELEKLIDERINKISINQMDGIKRQSDSCLRRKVDFFSEENFVIKKENWDSAVESSVPSVSGRSELSEVEIDTDLTMVKADSDHKLITPRICMSEKAQSYVELKPKSIINPCVNEACDSSLSNFSRIASTEEREGSHLQQELISNISSIHPPLNSIYANSDEKQIVDDNSPVSSNERSWHLVSRRRRQKKKVGKKIKEALA